MKARISLFSTAFLFSTLNLFAQGKLTYEGSYEQGQATYDYIEDASHQRLFDGKFSYTETRNIPARGGDNEILVTGNFSKDKKHLAWAVTVKPVEDGGVTETIIGNFLNGEKSGLWTHRILSNEDDRTMKEVQASFIKNHFRGPFSFQFDNPEATDYILIKIKGSFDNEGMLDGAWTIEYTAGTGGAYKEETTYKHGVLSKQKITDVSTGQVTSQVDNSALVEAFFANMSPVDSSSVVNDKKYGIRKAATEHKLLVPIIDAWFDMKRFELDNSFDATIPTMIIRKGVLTNSKATINQAEIIDWKDTPKGKKEHEAKMALEQAYADKLKLADLQMDNNNIRQAKSLYQEALTIKKGEAYPTDQIKKIDEMIRIEEEKNRVITIVNSKRQLVKGNHRMLEPETFYGKKKHLFEAATLALDHQKKQMRSQYEQTEAFLDRKAYDDLTLDKLNQFQADLDNAIKFQDRLKELVKQEDTKELEKELKKLEDPTAIISRIMG